MRADEIPLIPKKELLARLRRKDIPVAAIARYIQYERRYLNAIQSETVGMSDRIQYLLSRMYHRWDAGKLDYIPSTGGQAKKRGLIVPANLPPRSITNPRGTIEIVDREPPRLTLC